MPPFSLGRPFSRLDLIQEPPESVPVVTQDSRQMHGDLLRELVVAHRHVFNARIGSSLIAMEFA